MRVQRLRCAECVQHLQTRAARCVCSACEVGTCEPSFDGYLDPTVSDSIFRCSNCGGLNRVPEARLGAKPVCGGCKRRLAIEGEVQAVDGESLQSTVESSPVPVLVDLWAPWCGPCRMAAPIVESIAHAEAGKLITLKLNTDEDQAAAAQLRVQGIPTFVLFRDGKEVARQSGVMPRDQMLSWVRSR
jgi:thioredoxin 2